MKIYDVVDDDGSESDDDSDDYDNDDYDYDNVEYDELMIMIFILLLCYSFIYLFIYSIFRLSQAQWRLYEPSLFGDPCDVQT